MVTQFHGVMLYDMLEGVDADIEAKVLEKFENGVSFGDAEYTFVRWYKAERFFYAALYEHGLNQAEASDWMSRYNDIVGYNVVLVG